MPQKDNLISLDQDTIDALAEAMARRQNRMAAPVLNLDEAMHLVGKRTPSAFCRWCQAYGVTRCSQGRYSRRALEHGLNKEARARK